MLFVTIFIILIFLVLSAFFSGIETGLVSLDKMKLEQQAKEDPKKKKIVRFLKNPDKIFGTTLFGNNISLIIVSSLSVYLLHNFINKRRIFFSEQSWTLMVAGLLLIFAELLPKAIYRDFPNKLVTRTFSILIFFNILFTPFVKFVQLVNLFLKKIFKYKSDSKLVDLQDLLYILSEAKEDGTLHENQRDMLEEALEFSELKAENVMIHRTEIVALPKASTIDEIIDIAGKAGYTRFPVYGENLDDILGILIIYDLLKKKRSEDITAADFIRKPFFAPETKDVNTLLKEMQTQKKSIAIIVDSYGGTAGLVTIEDILEELVGEIEDEYDTSIREVEELYDGSFMVHGFVEIDFLNDEYDMKLPEGDFETIAGLIIENLARIPAPRTVLEIGDWEIKVIQVTNKKIIKVKMTKRETADEESI